MNGGLFPLTFAVEIMPNEVRFLVDSNVVSRIPDRLIPSTHREYDMAAQLPRGPMNFLISQFDIDNNQDHSDPMGNDSSGNSVTYNERKSFEHAAHASTWAGFRPYHGQMAAHHRVDYVKVWDVPSNVKVSGFTY